MRHTHFLHILLPLALLTAPSCGTILEDRDDCPCNLTLVLSHRSPAVPSDGLEFRLSEQDGTLFMGRSLPGNIMGGFSYSTQVPRRIYSHFTIAGKRNYELSSDGDRLVLPKGCEADSLFIHTSMVDCSGDSALDTILLHKQWCTMNFIINNARPDRRYVVTIDGNWAATRIGVPSAIEGEFQCRARAISDGLYQARIPRQGDNSLSFTLEEYTLDGSISSRILRFPIGVAIQSSGFDWGRLDLDDVDVVVDYASCTILADILPWYNGEYYGDLVL